MKSSCQMGFGVVMAVVLGGCTVEVPDGGANESKSDLAQDSSGSGTSPSSGSGATGWSGSSGSGDSATSSSSGSGSSGDTACGSSPECPGDQVCVFLPSSSTGMCTTPWGRVWRFMAVSAQLPGTNPATGQAWDELGGAPDPYVHFYAGKTDLGFSKPMPDTFQPTWNTYVDVVITADSPKLSFLVYDADVTNDDYVTGVEGPPAAWLANVKSAQDNGFFVWTEKGVTLTLFTAIL